MSEGERVFGYLPMATHLRVQPGKLEAQTFIDASPHRSALPAPYQRYTRVARGELAQEAARAALAPLFGTGFLIDDFLQDNALFGAHQVVLVSASSKTALGTAFSLARRPGRQYEIVGLTSARNRAFCERVGFYDRVVDYAQLAELPVQPCVLVDMAADASVLRALYDRLGDALRYTCLVGMTHQTGPLTPLPALSGPAPQMFFAPTQIERLRKEWGAAELERKVQAAERLFLESAQAWLTFEHGQGREAIERAYRSVLTGQATPDRALVLSF
jgi:hypothetical protein